MAGLGEESKKYAYVCKCMQMYANVIEIEIEIQNTKAER